MAIYGGKGVGKPTPTPHRPQAQGLRPQEAGAGR